MAVQTRLDAGLVGKYEAVLALYAVRLLFPTYGGGANILPTPDVIWPINVHSRLQCILEDQEWSGEHDNEAWLSIWQTLNATDQFISREGVKELLDSAAGLKGEDARGIHPLPAAGQAAGNTGENPVEDHAPRDSRADGRDPGAAGPLPRV